MIDHLKDIVERKHKFNISVGQQHDVTTKNYANNTWQSKLMKGGVHTPRPPAVTSTLRIALLTSIQQRHGWHGSSHLPHPRGFQKDLHILNFLRFEGLKISCLTHSDSLTGCATLTQASFPPQLKIFLNYPLTSSVTGEKFDVM